jgi:hypothetical protein
MQPTLIPARIFSNSGVNIYDSNTTAPNSNYNPGLPASKTNLNTFASNSNTTA